MGPEYLLLLHNLGHAELLVELEARARAIRTVREARAERIRALRRAADGAGTSIRRAAGVLTGHPLTGRPLTGRPLTGDRTPTPACDVACATA
jgi:hypothetical protein